MARGSFEIFRVPAIHRHARNFLLAAKILIPFLAELAFAARPVNPRNSDTVSDFQISDVRALLGYTSRDFVPQDQGALHDFRKLRPVAVRNMHIGVADAAGLDLNQNFVRIQLGTLDVFKCERLFEIVEDCGSHSHPFDDGLVDVWVVDGLAIFRCFDAKLRALRRAEKINRVANASHQLVWTRRSGHPVSYHRVVERFHELGEVVHRKCARDFFALLSLFQNFLQQARRNFFLPAHLRRSHRIHRPGQHHRLPKPAIRFHLVSKFAVETPQAIRGARVARKLHLQFFGNAGIPAIAHFVENRVLGGEIAEECGLTDFENLHNIFDAGIFVSLGAEEPQCGFNNFLAQPRFLALAESQLRVNAERTGSAPRFVFLRAGLRSELQHALRP